MNKCSICCVKTVKRDYHKTNTLNFWDLACKKLVRSKYSNHLKGKTLPSSILKSSLFVFTCLETQWKNFESIQQKADLKWYILCLLDYHCGIQEVLEHEEKLWGWQPTPNWNKTTKRKTPPQNTVRIKKTHMTHE